MVYLLGFVGGLLCYLATVALIGRERTSRCFMAGAVMMTLTTANKRPWYDYVAILILVVAGNLVAEFLVKKMSEPKKMR